MEDMIRRIIDMDKKAREITEAAQREKAASEREINEKAAQLREDYLSRARYCIQINRETEQKLAEQEWEKTRTRYDEELRRMDALYAERGDEWVRTIVAAVTACTADEPSAPASSGSLEPSR